MSDSRYGDFPPKDKAVEYFLEIVSDCRELHPTSSLDKFSDLEYLFKEQGFNGSLIEKLNDAKKIVDSLEPYSTHSQEYFKCFLDLKKSLADIQEEFTKKYKNSS